LLYADNDALYIATTYTTGEIRSHCHLYYGQIKLRSHSEAW